MPSLVHNPPDGSSTSEGLLEALAEVLATRRPRRVLLVFAGSAAWPLGTESATFQLYQVSTHPQTGQVSVACRIDGLPFQSRSFDMVVAQGVLSDGSEPCLPELERVLEGGGQLVALGPGHWGGVWRGRRLNGAPTAIRPRQLCRRLRDDAFTIELCQGHGLAGTSLETGRGWSKPLLGLADNIFISARHQGSKPLVTPLRFARPQAVGARSAALDGLNREAAP